MENIEAVLDDMHKTKIYADDEISVINSGMEQHRLCYNDLSAVT